MIFKKTSVVVYYKYLLPETCFIRLCY